MDKKEQLRNYLSNGYNCAQAVAAVFAGEVNQSEKTMLSAAAGFGGGIGRQAMTCGALAGATLVLGFDRGQVLDNDLETKEKCYKSVQELFNDFKKIYSHTACKDLLQCDISTPEGLSIHSSGVHRDLCRSYMDTIIDLLVKKLGK
ncbi:MAG: C-GCAxxG-C-C family protein [Bacteroidales bacterium]